MQQAEFLVRLPSVPTLRNREPENDYDWDQSAQLLTKEDEKETIESLLSQFDELEKIPGLPLFEKKRETTLHREPARWRNPRMEGHRASGIKRTGSNTLLMAAGADTGTTPLPRPPPTPPVKSRPNHVFRIGLENNPVPAKNEAFRGNGLRVLGQISVPRRGSSISLTMPNAASFGDTEHSVKRMPIESFI